MIMHAQGKVQAQKSTEKSLGLLLTLIIGKAHNNKKKKNEKNYKIQQILGKGKNLTFRVFIL